MRKLERLCKKLNKEVVGTYCVVKSRARPFGKSLFLYSVHYIEDGVSVFDVSFLSVAETERYLLDQFPF